MLGTVMTKARYAELLRSARGARESWLDLDAEVMARHYNRQPFLLQHRLDSHPDFALPALRELCHRLPAARVYCRHGAIPQDTHFDTSLTRPEADIGIDEAFETIETDQLYIAIYNPETDPAYRGIVDGLLGEIATAIRPFDRRINWYSTYVFISASGSVTPYHMDREMNFLLQIHGQKVVQLWDPNDDAVMSPAVRDHIFSAADDSRPAYRPELDALASGFELTPGHGVHHPFLAPHLVRTGPELSISLAVTFRTPRSDLWRDAHRFNERLRESIGWSAGRVGRFAALDRAKAVALRLIGTAKNAFRGRRAAR